MHLENLNPSKRNTSVTCNGTVYWIGHGGFIADQKNPDEPLDVSAADAAKLTQGKAWKELSWDPKDPKFARRIMPAPTGVGLGRRARTREELNWDQGIRPKSLEEVGGQVVTVPTKDGKPTGAELVEKPLTDEEIAKSHADTEAEVAAANAKELEQDTGLLSDMGEPVKGTDTTQEIEAATSIPKWAAPAEGAEWPDPIEEMPIEFLREMAAAYEVGHTAKTAKKTLIKNITKAMYEE